MDRHDEEAFERQAKRVLENWHGTVYVGRLATDHEQAKDAADRIALYPIGWDSEGNYHAFDGEDVVTPLRRVWEGQEPLPFPDDAA